MLSVVVMSYHVLIIVILNGVILSVIALSVAMLNVIMLNVFILGVVWPFLGAVKMKKIKIIFNQQTSKIRGCVE